MEVKKREILVSIIIALISIMIGIFISGKISDSQDAGRESYQKAIQIEEPEIFRHCMSVNSGDGLIYGELKAVDTVSDPKIEGEWLYLSKKLNDIRCTPERFILERLHVSKPTGLGTRFQLKSFTANGLVFAEWNFRMRK